MKIVIDINAGETHCDECSFLEYSGTGIAGEWNRYCSIFQIDGKWRKDNMKRPKECLAAEKKVRARK